MFHGKKRLTVNWFLVALILIALFLCYQNYTPGTILSGWDTLHPEFNFKLYLERITSVWQGHQGLGAPPAQAHASELPRMLFYGIFLLIFPVTFVRYAYIFLTVLLGPIGMFLFLQYLLGKKTDNKLVRDGGAFAGSLLYLLNLGTVQHYIVILEMFATNFAAAGFVFLFASRFMDHKKKRDLLWFILAIVFSSSMAHTATLWYVFFGGLASYLFFFTIQQKNYLKTTIQKAAFLLIIALLLNMYWILPNLYYSGAYSMDVIQSKIHRLFSEEAYLQNKYFGNVQDLLLTKNFLFNWFVSVPSDTAAQKTTTIPLMSAWNDHLRRPFVRLLIEIIGIMSFAGMIKAIRKKEKHLMSLIPFTLLTAFFLLSDMPLISTIFEYIRNHNPLIKEMLRFPFTKFSLYYIFSLCAFFGYSVFLILNSLKKRYIQAAVIALCAGGIIYTSEPSFQGNYISSVIRVRIPAEYYQLFDWSRKQAKGRILILPFQSLYGWVVYDWDTGAGTEVYQGAGFTWFGLSQPSLNREFDRWYPANEEAYREFYYALYSKDARLFESVLKKYNIAHVLLDKSVVLTGDANEQKKLFYPQTTQLLSKINGLAPEQHFGNDLTVYSYAPNSNSAEAYIVNNPPNIGPAYGANYFDQAYVDSGNYVTTDLKPSNTYYGRLLLERTERFNPDIFHADATGYEIKLPQSGNLDGSNIEFPSFLNTEDEIYTNVAIKPLDEQKSVLVLSYLLPYLQGQPPHEESFEFPNGISPVVSINNQTIPVATGRDSTLKQINIPTRLQTMIGFYDARNAQKIPVTLPAVNPILCSEAKGNTVFGAENKDNGFDMYGQYGDVCVDLNMAELVKKPLSNGLLEIDFSYRSPGLPISVCHWDTGSSQCLDDETVTSGSLGDKKIFIPIYAENNTILKFRLSATATKELATASIRNINAYFSPTVRTISFLPHLQQIQQVNSPVILRGDFPNKQFDINATTISADKHDCGPAPAKFIDKVINRPQKIIEYTAENGTLCDNFSFPDASKKTGQLLAIESRYIGGMPMRLCLEEDETKKCVLEDELSKNSEFKTDYFVVPPYRYDGSYFLTMQNISIGNVRSVTQIKSIRLIPFPFDFLQSIKTPVGELHQKSNKRDTEILYRNQYMSVIRPGTISLGDVLVLNQAYEKNWKAFLINDQYSNNPVARLLTPLFSRELPAHILVNNWSNGWLLNAPDDMNGNNIIMVFWPQYYLFAGYIAFIAALLVFLLYDRWRLR